MNARTLVAALLSILVTFVYLVFYALFADQRLEPLALDLWFNVRQVVSPPEAPQDVVIVAMDETSYKELNVPLNQPWPRRLHADLLERLADFGVKRVAYDILFFDAGPDKAVDDRLAKAIGTVPTILGAEPVQREESTTARSFRFEELLEAYDPFLEHAIGSALVAQPNDGGVVRRFWTERSEMTAEIPTLAEAAAGIDRATEKKLPGKRDFMRFYGPAGTFIIHHFYRVLEKEKPLPKETLKDKIVFVGLVLRSESGPAQKDIFGSPFYGSPIFGVEIHATAAANLIRKDWITRSSLFVECLLLGVICLVLTFLFILLRPQWAFAIAGGFIIMWIVTSYFSFTAGRFIPGLTLTTMVIPLVLLASTLYYYFVTHRAQLQIKSAFEYYLSPEMARQLADRPGSLKLGGEKLWATALFTDIEDFTKITEEMPAESVSAMLNAYFTEVMDVIFQNQGTLIKFIGDAVFVLWGAPIRLDNHAELAVKTALGIEREVKKFNDSNRFPQLYTRVGVNTGPMVVGNLGSARRFDYTAIGDSVNLAARLEGLNKHFGTDILLTESTRKELGNSVKTFELGSVRVVGKQQIVGLHTAFDNPPVKSFEDIWREARSLFIQRKWDDSEKLFAKCAGEEMRLRAAAELYISQIAENRLTAPEQTWQGELIFGSK